LICRSLLQHLISKKWETLLSSILTELWKSLKKSECRRPYLGMQNAFRC
jgi:hypothetical protein